MRRRIEVSVDASKAMAAAVGCVGAIVVFASAALVDPKLGMGAVGLGLCGWAFYLRRGV